VTTLDLVSTKQLAELTGLDARTCRTHALGAGLHEYAGRRFEREAALAAIKTGIDPRVMLGNTVAARGNVVLPGAAKLAEQKAREVAARADKMERQNAVADKTLISRVAVEVAVADIIARARTHFLGLGPRVAARLAAMDDEQAVRRLLDDEARTTLRELAKLTDIHAEILA
jgi:hypothetical protein